MTQDSITIRAIRARQPIGDLYVAVMSSDDLLRISSFDFRRMAYSGGYIDFLGIQRRVDPARSRNIAAYARTMDACFPGSVVISIEERCTVVERSPYEDFYTITISKYIDPVDDSLNIPLDEVASIIDGQHRLKGIQESSVHGIDIPVSIFVGVDEATDASVFSVVNLAQTKVNRSLVYDLFSLQKRRSSERTCHETVVALDRMDESPFQSRIKRLGVATEGRRGETLSQATVVKGLLPYVTSDALADRDRGRRFGFWEPVEGPENSRRIFRHFFVSNHDERIVAVMINYFNAIKERWPESWANTGEANIINRTNGYLGFMRFLRPAYLSLTTSNDVPARSDFLEIFRRVSLEEGQFTPQTFPPGSSGAKRLFDRLCHDTVLGGR